MNTNSTELSQIAQSLSDKAYRDAFVAQEIATVIPYQTRAIRLARGWTQKDIGDRAGMKQETISLLENPNYARVTIRTLLRLASAFDVGLLVRFVPFSTLVSWTIKSEEDLIPKRYENDVDLLG